MHCHFILQISKLKSDVQDMERQHVEEKEKLVIYTVFSVNLLWQCVIDRLSFDISKG